MKFPDQFQRIFVATILLAATAVAQAYPIELISHLGGMDLKLTAIDDPDNAIIGIRNVDARSAKCGVVFTNGPDLPQRRTTTIAAGKSRTLSFAIRRDVTKASVEISCAPAASNRTPKK